MSTGIPKREIVIKNGRNRKNRPKTFKSEEAAKAYAEKQGLKDYKIVNLKNDINSKDKFKIV